MKMIEKYIHVAIFNYPDAQLSAIHGITDILTTSNRFIKKNGILSPIFQITHWSLTNDQKKIKKTYSSTDNDTPFTILIIPPSLTMDLNYSIHNNIIQWIQSHYKNGAIISSICMGAFILAQTNLINNRTITTHWSLKNQFIALYPLVDLQIDRMLIDDGDIITAGGLMAWGDLSLKLVDRFICSSVMLETAKYFLIDPHGREQKFYNSFVPIFTHGDAPIVKVQQWLQANYSLTVTSQKLFTIAGLNERTFLRRFKKATGKSPINYLQLLRVNKAQELLETTSFPFNQITWEVGYNDVGAFHKLFYKITGLTPGEYRKKFSPNNN